MVRYLLLQYRELFRRLEDFGLIYVAADERMFPKAERIFRRSCGNRGDGLCVAGRSRYRAVVRALSGS